MPAVRRLRGGLFGVTTAVCRRFRFCGGLAMTTAVGRWFCLGGGLAVVAAMPGSLRFGCGFFLWSCFGGAVVVTRGVRIACSMIVVSAMIAVRLFRMFVFFAEVRAMSVVRLVRASIHEFAQQVDLDARLGDGFALLFGRRLIGTRLAQANALRLDACFFEVLHYCHRTGKRQLPIVGELTFRVRTATLGMAANFDPVAFTR